MQEEKLTSVQKRLRALAESAKLRNADLARISGVSPVAVGKWFSADQTPKAEQLLKLARHFEVSMEWLLTGHDPSAAELEELILVGNSREAAGQDTSSGIFSEENEERLIERIHLAAPAEVLAQCALVEETIQSLRQQAEVFSEFATNLLLEAERLETLLQSTRIAYNAVARSNTEAVREYERRHGNDDTDEG